VLEALTKRGSFMRFKSIILATVFLLSGCSYAVKTADISLNFQPSDNLTLGLAHKDISAEDMQGTISKDLHSPLYINNLIFSTVLAESKGRVAQFTNQPLALSLEYHFRPNFRPNDFIGIASFFIPFLGFIPESNEEIYRVDYAVKNEQGIVLYQRSLQGTVEGSMKGWYIARIVATNRLQKQEAELAAKNAARLVLKDIDESSAVIASLAREGRNLYGEPKRRKDKMEPQVPVATAEAADEAPQKAVSAAVTSDVDDLPSKKARTNKNSYAIVIGIEAYRQKLPRADFASHDAQMVTEYLTKVLGYPEENVVTLLNDRASNSDLAKYFEKWLLNNVEKGSTVFVYFSGHGAPNPQTGDAFLVPYDGDPSFIDQTGYSLKRLYENLNKLPAKEIVVALDSCFSGAGGRSVLAKGARPLVMNMDKTLVKSEKITVLSAASGDQISSTYDEKGHGLFTYFLLKGIKTEDVTQPDGSIKMDDLFGYLKPQVERIARKAYNNEQTPQLIEAKRQ